MRFRSIASIAATLTAGLLASGCGDSPVAPSAPPAAPSAPIAAPTSANNSLLGGLLGTTLGSPTTVTPLNRTSPLASDITTSKRIGLLGGVLSIPSAGITVVVPPLAVLSTTTISVTARAGSAVAYDFAPHGIKFAVPLVVTQSLAKTDAQTGLVSLNSLFAGYYPDSKNSTSVTELLTLNVNLLNSTAIMTVWHFSGYIFASGRSDSGE
jgi:hypothetical protein